MEIVSLAEQAKSKLGKKLKTRYAPTPSGFLHKGNAFSFVITWLLARYSEGEIFLRIDDIDSQRARKEYIDDIFESLAWLGLDFDYGARNAEEFSEKYSQSLRKEFYLNNLELLKQSGLVFACSCSRKNFSGKERCSCLKGKSNVEKTDFALRADTSEGETISFIDADKGEIRYNIHETMPFFVVLTKEKQPAYQLVSLSEDIRNGINFIARGEDLLASTAAQIWLSQKIKGAQQFSGAVFLHHELLKDENGKKLSKSEGASSLKNLRENGFPASELYREFSENLGIKECGSASEMLDFLKGETP